MGKRDSTPRSRVIRGVGILVLASCLPGIDHHTHAATQNNETAELTTQETQPSFRLQVQRNVVLVRVVVRDARGNAVGTLHQQDFRVLDDGKPQTITLFSLENAAANTAQPAKPERRTTPAEENPGVEAVPFTALRYMALLFDDVHADFDGLIRSRAAAEKYLAVSVHPPDRIGVFTSSGQGTADFTDDRSKIRDALLRLRPRPVVPSEINPCPDIFPYQAYLIVDRREQHALEEVAQEIVACRYNRDVRYLNEAVNEAQAEAVHSLMADVNQSQYTFRGIEQLVRRMASLPGQRSIILVSPGFFTETEKLTIAEVVDHALRSRVVISALDSKGLYAYVPLADATRQTVVIPERPDLMGKKVQDQGDSVRFNQDVLAQLARETGGVFFENSNDLDEGFRKVGALPEFAYVLGFSPQKLKFDGHLHSLKVSLSTNARLTVQARRGYFAPRKAQDLAEQQKQDIEEALFSQDELSGLPVNVHTQFFKINERQSRLSVIAHMDLRPVHFRKQGGRNLNNITFVTAVFDRDGNYVTGKQKTIEFHLLDNTLSKLVESGISTKTSFDVAPGAYVVREIVRDSEEGQLTGVNRMVEVPF